MLFAVADSLPIPAAEEVQGVVGIVTFAFVALRLRARASAEAHADPAFAAAL